MLVSKLVTQFKLKTKIDSNSQLHTHQDRLQRVKVTKVQQCVIENNHRRA